VPFEPPPEPEPPLFAVVALETEVPCEGLEEGGDALLDGAGWLDSGPNSVATWRPEARAAGEDPRHEAEVVSCFAVTVRSTDVPVLACSEPDVACAGAVYSLGPTACGALSALACLAGAHRMRWSVFSFWNALGGIAWASVVGVLAYLLGPSWSASSQSSASPVPWSARRWSSACSPGGDGASLRRASSKPLHRRGDERAPCRHDSLAIAPTALLLV
jgi:hypothetical protein